MVREEEKRLGVALQALNEKMKSHIKPRIKLERKEFESFLEKRGGRLASMEKCSTSILEKLGSVVGVDGSVNRKGGAYPHYIEIYRGLALSTGGEREYVESIYTPLLEEPMEDILENPPVDARPKFLAAVELDVAIAFLKKHSVKVLMMDGGLIRYKIQHSKKWEELKDLCVNQKTLLLGVIKDIKTNILAGEEGYYDREILYGNFPYAKVLFIDHDKNQKYKEGFSSAFLRPSKSIQVIGLDMPLEQEDYLEEMANLVYSLTPQDGRGVPIWLDMVDRECKISDKYMQALLEQYLDRDIYMRFFVSERDGRKMR